jgi:hypothetical protein
MNAAAEKFACWLIMGKRDDSPRARRSRRRNGLQLRRHFRRLLVNLSLGFLLVGCAGQRPFQFARHTVDDPVMVLRTSQEPNQRIVAYRQLGSEPQSIAQHQELAGLLLVQGLEKEVSPLARAAAAKSLRHYDLPEARQALRKATTDSSPMVRVEAARSLGALAGSEAVEVLAQMAKSDDDVDVRLAACQTLGDLRDPQCNDHLLECLLDRDVAVTEAACKGLRANTGVDMAANYEAWKSYIASGKVPEDAPRIADNSGGGLIFGKILR